MKKRHNRPGPSRFRFILVMVVFASFFFVVAGQAFRIQVLENEMFAEKAEKLYLKEKVLTGKRGTILDARGVPLAMSIDAVSIGIRPQYLPKDPKYNAARAEIGKIVGKSQKELAPVFASSGFAWLSQETQPEVAEKLRDLVKTLDLAPEQKKRLIEVFETNSRVYPNRSIAAQLVGFTGREGQGLEGLEYHHDNILKGDVWHETFVRGPRSGVFNEEIPLQEESHGKDIVLTIDRGLQFITEKALADAAIQADAASGMAVVMSPKTGEILAMANYPSFNPNNFLQFPKANWRNRVVTDVFEPGSTLKIFLVAGALEQNFVEPESTYFCENGVYRIGARRIRDTKPHGWLSVSQILKYSSNIGSVKISEVLGRENLHKILTGFGFGKKTDIDTSGETAGLLSHWQRWYPQDTGSIAFGQGISTTALQLVVAAGAIANGGNLMQPYLIKEVRDPMTGEVQKTAPKVVRRVISPETSEIVKTMMASVTETGGTGVQAATYGYQVAGKTGTSQKQEDDGTYSRRKYIASFLGFAPLKDPEFVVLVVLDEPRKKQYGGTAAAPAFKVIVSEGLAYMNIPPENITPFTFASFQEDAR